MLILILCQIMYNIDESTVYAFTCNVSWSDKYVFPFDGVAEM